LISRDHIYDRTRIKIIPAPWVPTGECSVWVEGT